LFKKAFKKIRSLKEQEEQGVKQLGHQQRCRQWKDVRVAEGVPKTRRWSPLLAQSLATNLARVKTIKEWIHCSGRCQTIFYTNRGKYAFSLICVKGSQPLQTPKNCCNTPMPIKSMPWAKWSWTNSRTTCPRHRRGSAIDTLQKSVDQQERCNNKKHGQERMHLVDVLERQRVVERS